MFEIVVFHVVVWLSFHIKEIILLQPCSEVFYLIIAYDYDFSLAPYLGSINLQMLAVMAILDF